MRDGRVDANQAEIVEALRAISCSVAVTSSFGAGFPDLVVGRAGKNYLLEVKSDDGKLNIKQMNFHGLWRGQVAVVRNVEEAMLAVGLKEI